MHGKRCAGSAISQKPWQQLWLPPTGESPIDSLAAIPTISAGRNNYIPVRVTSNTRAKATSQCATR